MNTSSSRREPRWGRWWLFAMLCVMGVLTAVAFYWPPARQLVAVALDRAKFSRAVPDGHAAHDERTAHHDDAPSKAAVDVDGHDAAEHEAEEESEHDHEKEPKEADGHLHASETPDAHGELKTPSHKHDEAAALTLSVQAIGNIGLRLEAVELRPFERTITIPGILVERPGRTNIQVSAPLTGMIARVWPMQGETVVPGQPLFDLRLTHEEVVEAQSDFLKTANELDVVRREIERLEKIAAEGIVSGKTLLERKYELQKLQASQHAQRQRLLLHGLSQEQVDEILEKQALLNKLTISVPERPERTQGDASHELQEQVLQVEQLKIEKGQHVKAGDTLCVLADFSELFVQGKAFEQDAPVLDKAANNDWHVTAVMDAGGQERQTVSNLQILYVAGKVEPESRAVLFYVRLPNKLIRNRETTDGHRFSAWQFKPGQRSEILVPIEKWEDRIVLPIAALVQEGAESYVFEQNDDHFDRRSVRVEYRDQHSVVIANDGALAPGKMVVVSGAYQIHLAMKNKSGGGVDPHAGHNH